MEARISQVQKNVQDKIKTETDKLSHRFDSETRKLSQQFSARLDMEHSKMVQLVEQVTPETEAELVGAKKHRESVNEQLVERLTQQTAQMNSALSETDNKLLSHKQVIDSNVNRLDSLDAEMHLVKDAVKETSDLGLR
jgi:chromosome segregation ATPase